MADHGCKGLMDFIVQGAVAVRAQEGLEVMCKALIKLDLIKECFMTLHFAPTKL